MEVSAWTNGQGYYGIKVKGADRERYFERSWNSVEIELDNRIVQPRLSPSFWKRCRELRGKEIGGWLKEKALIPWPEGKPPRFDLLPLSGNRFRLTEHPAAARAEAST